VAYPHESNFFLQVTDENENIQLDLQRSTLGKCKGVKKILKDDKAKVVNRNTIVTHWELFLS
jgi:hypothetical protein